MAFLEVTQTVRAAREKWRYRGGDRPPFAHRCASHQESVWDFPRPPRIETVSRRLSAVADGEPLATTERGVRVVETAGAPTYYFPPQDVRLDVLQFNATITFCEWKGVAREFDAGVVDQAGWRIEQVFEDFAVLEGWCSFYPAAVHCFVDGIRVDAQPGGYYGGWVTPELAGPIKGEPGTEHW